MIFRIWNLIPIFSKNDNNKYLKYLYFELTFAYFKLCCLTTSVDLDFIIFERNDLYT